MKVSDSKRAGKAMLFSEEGGAAVGAVSYAIGTKGADLTVMTRLNAQPQQAVLQKGPERGYRCMKPMELGATLHTDEGELAAVWVLCAGKPAAFARLGSAAFDKARAREALDAALAPPQPAPVPAKQPPSARHEAPVAPAVISITPPIESSDTSPEAPSEALVQAASVATDVLAASKPAGFDMQPTVSSGAAPSFRGRLAPYGLTEEPDAPSSASALDAVQPLPAAEPAAAQPEEQPKEQPKVQAVEAQPQPEVTISSAAKTGITIKRAQPVSLPRDTPLWADIQPQVEAMLDALPSAQPFAAATDSARFAALPLEGAVQCYIGSVVVGGIKVLLQAVPARPFHRPAGFDHTLVSRDGDSFWVRYEIEDMLG